MAQRESQGLQIALIILVMLTIILSVTTFLFFKKYDEGRQAAKTADEKRTKAEGMYAKANKRVEAVLPMVDPAIDNSSDDSEAKVKEVQKQFAEDMKNYEIYGAGKFGEKLDDEALKDVGVAVVKENERSYPHLVGQMATVITRLSQRVAAQSVTIDELQQQVVSTKQTGDAKAKKLEDSLTEAVAKFTAEKTDYDTARKNADGKYASLSASLGKRREEYDKGIRAAETTIAARDKQVKELDQQNSAIADRIGKIINEDVEIPDGKIMRVDQRERVVYINLGSDDNLRPRTTFSVYAIDENDLVNTEPKGKIEVTRVHGPHLAEARIRQDFINDPILSGDRVYSPIWHPGRQIHFAIAGEIDFNGDDVSDLQKTIDLIHTNGGIVDVYLDEQGNHLSGTGEKLLAGKGMTTETQYLIVGERPTEASKKQMIQAYSSMTDQARKQGVEELNIQRFLDMMGYRPDTRTQPLGKGAVDSAIKPGDNKDGPSRRSKDDSKFRRRPAGAAPPSSRNRYYRFSQ